VKYQNITINHLRTFLVVARLGSFNRAAEELSRTQPAVTLAIKQLEECLGLSLFERTTRRVAPTPDAENFVPMAQRLVREFDLAIEDMSAAAECRSGHVSLMVLPSVTTRLLPSIISSYSRQYPNIGIHLSDSNARSVQAAVERSEVDFGIGSQWSNSSKLEFAPLCEDTFQLVCHREHPLAQETAPLSWRKLGRHTFIGSGLTKSLKMQKYVGSPRFECTTVNSLFAMLKANLGVTALPSLAVPEDADLVSIPLSGPVETRRICLITRRNSNPSPAAAALIDLLVKEVPAVAGQSRTLTAETARAKSS
jgi:DNA-binding transcriptional LysR family regulator